MQKLDKRTDIDGLIGRLRDGMTIGIGGWATRRKPMALIRAIARSDLRDLTVVSYGGPDVGLLAAAGKIKKLIFAFVSLDHHPVDPHFRTARQAAAFEVLELDEGVLQLGLRATAMRVPFLPTRIGVGTDVMRQPFFRSIRNPFDESDEMLAFPAIKLDAALLHVHRSDERGNVLTLSPDPLFDEHMARAADQVLVTTEQLVSTQELDMANNSRYQLVERTVITAVAPAPFGAHPTSAAPDYQIDFGSMKEYIDSAASPEAWAKYRAKFVDVGASEYLEAAGGAARIQAQPKPVY